MSRYTELASMADVAKRLANAEFKVWRASEALEAMPVDARARAGRGGGRKATATARLRTACEARDRVDAEFRELLVTMGFAR